MTSEVAANGERVNVYVPKSLLDQIERFGQRTGIDNSLDLPRLAARHKMAADQLRSEAALDFEQGLLNPISASTKR